MVWVEIYGRHMEKHAKNTSYPHRMTSDEEMPSEHERTHSNHCIFFIPQMFDRAGSTVIKYGRSDEIALTPQTAA